MHKIGGRTIPENRGEFKAVIQLLKNKRKIKNKNWDYQMMKGETCTYAQAGFMPIGRKNSYTETCR